jgi:hypothetical protein
MRLQRTLLLLCAAYLAVDGAWTSSHTDTAVASLAPLAALDMFRFSARVPILGHKHVPCAARALDVDRNTRNAALHYYMQLIIFSSSLNESCMPACDSSRCLQNSCLFMCQYRLSTQPQLCSIRCTHSQSKHLLYPCFVSATQQLCHLRNTSLTSRVCLLLLSALCCCLQPTLGTSP